jgi:hypothetical protein
VRFADDRRQEAKDDWERWKLEEEHRQNIRRLQNPLEAVEVSSPSNSGRRWTAQDIYELKLLARANTPADLIACELQRTKESVRAIAKREGIALRWAGKDSSTTE